MGQCALPGPKAKAAEAQFWRSHVAAAPDDESLFMVGMASSTEMPVVTRSIR
jgi:hypothetical protein